MPGNRSTNRLAFTLLPSTYETTIGIQGFKKERSQNETRTEPDGRRDRRDNERTRAARRVPEARSDRLTDGFVRAFRRSFRTFRAATDGLARALAGRRRGRARGESENGGKTEFFRRNERSDGRSA